MLVIMQQIVELHDWTAFSSTGSEQELDPGSFRILMEAEPGLVKRHQYRKVRQIQEISLNIISYIINRPINS